MGFRTSIKVMSGASARKITESCLGSALAEQLHSACERTSHQVNLDFRPLGSGIALLVLRC